MTSWHHQDHSQALAPSVLPGTSSSQQIHPFLLSAVLVSSRITGSALCREGKAEVIGVDPRQWG